MKHSEFLRLRNFEAFDGLRGVAAVMVALFHFGGGRWDFGWIGVHLFFVLSGFLITTLALREQDARGHVSIPAFVVRREFRIVPVYLVVLAVTIVRWHVREPGANQHILQALPFFLTFTSEYCGPSPFFHSWTVGIEQKFYLGWSLIAFGRPWKAKVRSILTGLLVGVLLACWPSFAFAPHYWVLLLGCMLSMTMHDARGYGIIRSLAESKGGQLFSVLFVVVHFGIRHAVSTYGIQLVIAGYGILAAAWLPTLIDRSLLHRLLSNRILVFLGKRSYSLYLVQFLAHDVVDTLVPGLPPRTSTGLAVAATGFAIADLLYRLVESPLIAAGKRVSRRLERDRRTPSR